MPTLVSVTLSMPLEDWQALTKMAEKQNTTIEEIIKARFKLPSTQLPEWAEIDKAILQAYGTKPFTPAQVAKRFGYKNGGNHFSRKYAQHAERSHNIIRVSNNPNTFKINPYLKTTGIVMFTPMSGCIQARKAENLSSWMLYSNNIEYRWASNEINEWDGMTEQQRKELWEAGEVVQRI